MLDAGIINRRSSTSIVDPPALLEDSTGPFFFQKHQTFIVASFSLLSCSTNKFLFILEWAIHFQTKNVQHVLGDFSKLSLNLVL
jgi:hypothetical protein